MQHSCSNQLPFTLRLTQPYIPHSQGVLAGNQLRARELPQLFLAITTPLRLKYCQFSAVVRIGNEHLVRTVTLLAVLTMSSSSKPAS